MSQAKCHQTSNISRSLVGNKIVDQLITHRLSALLQLHLHSRLDAWHQWIGQGQNKTRRESFKFWYLVPLILNILLCLLCIDSSAYTLAQIITGILERPTNSSSVIIKTISNISDSQVKWDCFEVESRPYLSERMPLITDYLWYNISWWKRYSFIQMLTPPWNICCCFFYITIV